MYTQLCAKKTVSCVCACVCVCIHPHIYMHILIYIHTQTYNTYAKLPWNTHFCMHSTARRTQLCASKHPYSYIHINIETCIHTNIYTHTNTQQIYQVTTEYTALRALHSKKTPALRIQTPLAYGCHKELAYVLVTDLLGDNVQALVPKSGFVSPKTVLLLAHQV